MIQVDEKSVLFIGGANWEEHLDSCEIMNFSKFEKVKLKPIVVKHKSPQGKTSWKGFRGNGNSYSESKELPLEWSDDKSSWTEWDGNRIYTSSQNQSQNSSSRTNTWDEAAVP